MQNDVPSSAASLSMTQVGQMAGISSADVSALVDYGVLNPLAPDHQPWTFNAACVVPLQRAEILRQDLALDSHAFALAVMFLNQVSSLEAQLHAARTELAQCRKKAGA